MSGRKSRFSPLKSYAVEALILLDSETLSSEPCFPGFLWLSFFLSVPWVTSLESVLRSGYFVNLQFYPIFWGSPNGCYASALRPAPA